MNLNSVNESLNPGTYSLKSVKGAVIPAAFELAAVERYRL